MRRLRQTLQEPGRPVSALTAVCMNSYDSHSSRTVLTAYASKQCHKHNTEQREGLENAHRNDSQANARICDEDAAQEGNDAPDCE